MAPRARAASRRAYRAWGAPLRVATVAALVARFKPSITPTPADVAALVARGANVSGERGALAFLAAADRLLGTHGVECVRQGAALDSVGGAPVLHYCNTGDSYESTIAYDVGRGRVLITSYGDWVETWEARHGGRSIDEVRPPANWWRL